MSGIVPVALIFSPCDTPMKCICNFHLNISNTNLKTASQPTSQPANQPAIQVPSQSAMVWHHLSYRTEKCPFKLQNCKLNCRSWDGRRSQQSVRSLCLHRSTFRCSGSRSHNSIPDEIHAISFARREQGNT